MSNLYGCVEASIHDKIIVDSSVSKNDDSEVGPTVMGFCSISYIFKRRSDVVIISISYHQDNPGQVLGASESTLTYEIKY